jgi:gluconate 2-dehydrogenase gamma chain
MQRSSGRTSPHPLKEAAMSLPHTPERGCRRRDLLATVSALLLARAADAKTYGDGAGMPWRMFAGEAPPMAPPGPWQYFTPAEGAAAEALVDRIIPPDPDTPGGKDAGCAVFIDRQLAGPYGSAEGLYMRPPFQAGTPEQGMQSAATPAVAYRRALAALDRYCTATYLGKTFAQLPDDEKDKVIGGLETGTVQFDGATAVPFFEILLQNTREGFFADPIYGGNRDMAGWRMIGFPGTRYDYRDWVERHNERYPLPPVSLAGRKEWSGAAHT